MSDTKFLDSFYEARCTDHPDWVQDLHRQIYFLNFHRLAWLSAVTFLIHLPILYVDLNRIEIVDHDLVDAARLIFDSHLGILAVTGSYVIIFKILKCASPEKVTFHHKAFVVAWCYFFFICMSVLAIGEYLINSSVTPFVASLFAFAAFVLLPHISSVLFMFLNTSLLLVLLNIYGLDPLGSSTQKINLIMFSVVALFISRMVYFQKVKEYKHRKKIEGLVSSLREANDNVKVLSGFLPICSYCKKIRDDQGYWSQLEAYIDTHSEAAFSHGICPNCLNRHYPDNSGAPCEDKKKPLPGNST